jgi:hypothetical protein
VQLVFAQLLDGLGMAAWAAPEWWAVTPQTGPYEWVAAYIRAEGCTIAGAQVQD